MRFKVTNDSEREKHRKNIKYRQKEKKQRSIIAKDLLHSGHFRNRITKKIEEKEERAYRKHRKIQLEGFDIQDISTRNGEEI